MEYLIIAVLNNGLNILGVSSYYQDVIRGLVILIAVLSDRKRIGKQYTAHRNLI